MRAHGLKRLQERGQSVAELAIVLPILMLLLLAILQIGFILSAQVALTNAAREAARNASSIPVATATDAGTAATTYYGRLTDVASGFLKRNVGGYDPNSLVIAGAPTDLSVARTRVCYFSITDASGAPAVMARVEVEYSHPLFIPLIAPLLDDADGLSDGGLRLSATEDIRVGNLVLKATDIGAIGSPTCNS